MTDEAVPLRPQSMPVIGSLDWGLTDKLRFPRTRADWSTLVELPPMLKPPRSGQHSYDLLVHRKTRSPLPLTLGKLLKVYRRDFERASNLLTAAQWRVLFYLDLYPFAALAIPEFDGKQTVRRIIAQEPSSTDVPGEWTGSNRSIEEELLNIRIAISDTDSDTAKAVYAILGYARRLGLQKCEVLQIVFWEIWWLERHLNAVH